MKHRACTRSGYTLIEIVVVVAVIGVLASLVLGQFRRGRAVARRAQCNVQLESLALALDAYRQEQGHFPEFLHELSSGGYVQDPTLMRCPDDPDPQGSYENFYVIRDGQDEQELPLLVCPYHENDRYGVQAYVGRYTTQFMTRPAILSSARAATVQHPAQDPIAAPVGLQLHGADRVRTAKNGAATIDFVDGSSATLSKNCDVTVLQSFLQGKTLPTLCTLLRQTTGEVDYVVHTGSKFDVTTPVATAGALGTKFKITVAANADTTLLVTQGHVRFVTSRGRLHAQLNVPITAHRP